MMHVREALRRAPLIDDLPGLHLLAVGSGWDLLRVTAEPGFLALAMLRTTGQSIGPVLYDRPSARLYFAIPSGTTDSWQDLPVRLLSHGSWLVAPSPYRAHEYFGGWCELPDDDTLTDPEKLRHALHKYAATTATPEESPSWKPSNAPASMPTSAASPPDSPQPSALQRS
ncbi:hypothetical protein OG453_02865 [Streptomyces sp. NBC_01381]|uniref:hypothetical protein n=1 Tax=Streptomyces sp. NBC_01381 TaxID=2903845 RepID=UPI00225771A4|nr:hypothetical protein [Streptomyces sp. NBC_01381]MCX4665624.1 hypothetical protein [Streptomyces sp. NBC_01381]